jgi:hypothetical protein
MWQGNLSVDSVNVRMDEGLTFVSIDDGKTHCEYGLTPNLIPIDEVDLWVHEFSELSIHNALINIQPTSMKIPISISIVAGQCLFRVPHLMVSFHTHSVLRVKRYFEPDLRLVMTPEQFECVVKYRGQRPGENSPQGS